MTQQTLFEIAPRFVNRNTKAVTFQGKLDLPIHRWYRLTPSFSPRLATDIACEFKLNEKDFVLDPFSGVGTVPLCMKHCGIPSCSVEINPYLHFVGTVKTRTYSNLDAVRDVFHDFAASADRALNRLPADRQAEDYLAENAQFVPALHNIRRWWSPGNLMQARLSARVASCVPRAARSPRFAEDGVAGRLNPGQQCEAQPRFAHFCGYSTRDGRCGGDFTTEIRGNDG